MEQLLLENTLVVTLFVAWVLPWKGVALWKAARLGQKKWFIVLLVVNTAAVLEICYIFFVARKKSQAVLKPEENLPTEK